MVNVLVIMNGMRSSHTVRGGDYHVARILKGWENNVGVSIILPKIILKNIRVILHNLGTVHLSSKNDIVHEVANFPRTYIPRVVRSFFFRA